MKRVLVTGATGFIGRHCLQPLLSRGFEVHAVHHVRPADLAGPPGPSLSGASRNAVHWHAYDLLAHAASAALLADVAPSHLLHLAWYAVPGKYWTSRANLAWVRASLALYEAFVAAGGKRLVIGGTSAEYDWSHGICREGETPLQPRTYYGTCKHALAEIVAADARVAGVSAAWARFFFLYGAHEYPDRLIASVIRALLRGDVARTSPGTQRRDFLHVADAAAATVALLDSAVEGPVNIASGTAVSVRSIVERVAALIGGTGGVELGALPPDDPPLIVADVRRLRDEVGFLAAHDPDDRLRETIAWWRGQA